MTNAILSTSSLPETLLRLIHTEKVHIQEADNGIIRIIPVREGSGFRGLAKGSKFTTEKLLAYRREDMELEE